MGASELLYDWAAHGVQQQVAELIAELLIASAVNRFKHLIDFLKRAGGLHNFAQA